MKLYFNINYRSTKIAKRYYRIFCDIDDSMKSGGFAVQTDGEDGNIDNISKDRGLVFHYKILKRSCPESTSSVIDGASNISDEFNEFLKNAHELSTETLEFFFNLIFALPDAMTNHANKMAKCEKSISFEIQKKVYEFIKESQEKYKGVYNSIMEARKNGTTIPSSIPSGAFINTEIIDNKFNDEYVEIETLAADILNPLIAANAMSGNVGLPTNIGGKLYKIVDKVDEDGNKKSVIMAKKLKEDDSESSEPSIPITPSVSAPVVPPKPEEPKPKTTQMAFCIDSSYTCNFHINELYKILEQTKDYILVLDDCGKRRRMNSSRFNVIDVYDELIF